MLRGMNAQVPGPLTVTSSPIIKVNSPSSTQATSSLSWCRCRVLAVPAGNVSSNIMMLSFVSRPSSFKVKERPGDGESKCLPPPAGKTKPSVVLNSVPPCGGTKNKPGRLDPPGLDLGVTSKDRARNGRTGERKVHESRVERALINDQPRTMPNPAEVSVRSIRGSVKVRRPRSRAKWNMGLLRDADLDGPRISDCGFYVLVQPKQVGRIIPVLEGDEPSIIVAIGGPDPCCFLSVQVIDIDFAGRERFHCRPELTSPLDLMC